jgi:hypothetical protein
MKGTVIAVSLDDEGSGYVAQKIGPTLRMSTSPSKIPQFFETVVPAILLVKKYAESNAKILQQEFNMDCSDFGSQSSQNSQEFLKSTWLGPKTSAPSVLPSLPNDMFSQYETY